LELTDLPDEPTRLFKLIPDWVRVSRVMYLGTFVIFAMVTQYMVNAADTAMVGMLDDAELATASQAALGLGMPLFWAIGGFFSAISYGTQALTARRYAEGDDLATGKVLFNSLVAGVICAALGSTIGYVFSPDVVQWLAKASPEQARLGIEYIQIRSVGIAGMVLTFSYKSFFDGIGRTYVHLIAALFMNVFNIGLNYLLIFGSPSMGIPELGLAGAAWASTCSTFMGLGIMALISLRGRYRRRFAFYRRGHLDMSVIGKIIKLMLPSGTATVILMAGFLLFMMYVGDIDARAGGTNTYSAATKIVMDTAAVCFMPLMAVGTACATAVSQSLGAHKPNLAASYGWETLRLWVWIMAVVGIAFALWPEEILFATWTNDPAVARAGAIPLRMVGSSLPMMAVGMILSQSLYGAGANNFVLAAEGALHLLLFMPLAYLLGPVLQVDLWQLWIAAIVYVNALGVVMGTKFMTRGWREIRL
jgi:putative MATE family efflux protein